MNNLRFQKIYLCCCKDWKLLFFDSAVSIDAADLDAASTVFAACSVSAGICFCCYSILLLREDLSRNLELTESTPIVPADYVSAGHTDTLVIPTETPIIAPTIPPSLDYTPASPDYSPASDSESDPSEDPSSDHIPPLPAISPFLSSDDDPTDSDTPDTPSLPTHDTPFTEITAFT
ncbi:hypothetical protein Tco_1054726 [Tanacetum coccineum]|uniref:Uncharacterized protein n=1 Tax=Tanacetum coccineum TaxID=301880 RepID=A0ABQ5GYN6_9ASTR